MKTKALMKRIVVLLLHAFALVFYEKRYLTGALFRREFPSKGWILIMKSWFIQKILGINRHVPWPCSPSVMIADPRNIVFDNENIDNFFSVGCYFQGIGAEIVIGKGTVIAPGCGFITANHDIHDLGKSDDAKPIHIGKNCWIGMNCVILPGVTLADHTIVGAGAIVTKSFLEGFCVIAGNPARLLRKLDNNRPYERE